MSDNDQITTEMVLERIEAVTIEILDALQHSRLPAVGHSNRRSFTVPSARSFTNVLLVLAYCHNLLLSDRTTTTREVYYYYVTHFKHQRETDTAIWECATLLQVPRHALGLQAASRGWMAGDIQLIDNNNNSNTVLWDGRTPGGGLPITADWLLGSSRRRFTVNVPDTVQFVLVVEKEGIYQRLVQEELWDTYNCIIITGKGFPDLATRAAVECLHRVHELPVLGLADCDPFGVHVLHCYSQGSTRGGGGEAVVDVQWLGLRPSQVNHLVDRLPGAVFQELTDLDEKRLDDMLLKSDTHPFVQAPGRYEELLDMRESKVELEALQWIGIDFCEAFVGELLEGVGVDEDDYDSDQDEGMADAWKRIL